MSWTARSKRPFDPTQPESLEVEVSPPTPAPETVLEFTQQFVAAMQAVAALGEGVGRSDGNDLYDLTISGHANPGHAPADGFGPEFISVNLSVHKDYGQG